MLVQQDLTADRFTHSALASSFSSMPTCCAHHAETPATQTLANFWTSWYAGFLNGFERDIIKLPWRSKGVTDGSPGAPVATPHRLLLSA